MRATVGRIVHYVSEGSPVLPDGTQKYQGTCRAAIVTQVLDADVIGLCAINPTGFFFHPECTYAEPEDRAGGSWHWPCARAEVETS